MYHSTLKFYYYGEDQTIVTMLSNLKPKFRFDHEICTHENIVTTDLINSDIFILDKQITGTLKEMRQQLKPHAIFILCEDARKISDLDHEDYEAIDDIWPKPLSALYLLFRLEQILDTIKMRKDKDLHEQYLDTLIDSMPDMVWFKDNEGIHKKVNLSFCNTVGKTREDVTNKDHCYIWDVAKEDFDKGEFVCSETEDIVRKLRKTCRFNEKVKSKNGLRQFRTYKSPIFDDDGNVMGTVGIGHDITDLENMSTELELILRSMPFAILVKNDKNMIVNVNDRFEDYFGISKDSITNKDYDAWKQSALTQVKMLNDNGLYECHNLINEQILECSEEAIYDIFDNNVGQICIFRDITVETTLENQILLNSNTDFMTGLYNRRYLYEYMAEHSHVKQVSMLYVDLDDFKLINDNYGHQVGDEALQKVSEVLKTCFVNDFSARIGGDEFLVIMLEEYNKNVVTNRVVDLLQQLKETTITKDHLHIISASIGITTACNTTIDLDDLIKQSDIALYQAKLLGKAQYCFYDKDYATG